MLTGGVGEVRGAYPGAEVPDLPQVLLLQGGSVSQRDWSAKISIYDKNSMHNHINLLTSSSLHLVLYIDFFCAGKDP